MRKKTIKFAVLLTLVISAYVCGDSYLSPADVVYDGSRYLYIADATGNQVQEFDTQTDTVTRSFALDESPNGLTIVPGADPVLYVAAGSKPGYVYKIPISSGTITETYSAGHTPTCPVVDGQNLYVANRFDNNISVIDLASGSTTALINVLRDPMAMAITPDSQRLLVVNHLPVDPANTSNTACRVSAIDLTTETVTANISLYNGATGAKDICISPDGNYAYVTYLLARYQMPTTQLDRGWVMTNALGIIDLQQTQLLTTILLDDVYMGAANPWAVECTDDGSYLCVTHAGSHELSVIDRFGLHARLDALAAGTPIPGGFSDTINDLPHDLGFLTAAGLRNRIALGGNGPRSLAIVDSACYIPEYFSGTISIVGVEDSSNDVMSVALGTQPASTQVRQGEIFYHDASQTYQKWLSCSSCHPGARADGLNWDLGNDGLGTARQVKSHLLAHNLPPTTITGVRDSAETSVRAGFKFIEFADRPEEDAVAIDEYLKSLKPVASPTMVDDTLTEAAWRGKTLFHQAGCASCHLEDYYANDMQVFDPENPPKYDVGTGYGSGEAMDTPTLVEVWQTAPYLHDGRAMTIKEVVTTYNPNDQHGVTSNLDASQIDDLVEYVKSISAVTHSGDIDDNGVTNMIDLEHFYWNWLNTDCGLCDFSDFNTDGDVDMLDFSIFGSRWLLIE